MPPPIKNIRHNCHNRTNTAQYRQRILHPHILIKWHSHDRHSTGRRVPRYSHETECRGGIDVIGVDNVHVGGDEDGYGAEAEDRGGDYGGPD